MLRLWITEGDLVAAASKTARNTPVILQIWKRAPEHGASLQCMN